MEEGDCVGGEDLAVGPGETHSMTDVLDGVVGGRGVDFEAMMDARVKRSIATHGESRVKLGQADEEERQQGSAIPFVIGQDVQVIEYVLVKQVSLVEKEDGVDLLFGEIFDVRADGVEDGGGSRRRREAERQADLSIEVAAAEGRVMAIGESESLLRETVAQCT